MTSLRRNAVAAAAIVAGFLVAGLSAVALRNYCFDRASLALKEGNYTVALDRLKPLAHLGDSDSQYLIGELFAYGWGVRKDDAAAITWFRRAGRSAEGVTDKAAPAMFYVGERYFEGLGVPRDPQEARKWFERSARGGYERAGEYLSRMSATDN